MKKCRKYKGIGLLLSVLLAVGLNLSAVHTASASVEIPAGATIDYATLSVYLLTAPNQEITVHRVTADWDEMTVTWNSFGSSFDPVIQGSFSSDATGWKSVDVTDLVKSWLDGSYPNYGLLLAQSVLDVLYTQMVSSDSGDILNRPQLEIGYTTPDGSFYVVIQQMFEDPKVVEDTYIWALPTDVDNNHGASTHLYEGYKNGYEKYCLIRFDVTMPPPSTGGGGHTPGFWQNRNGQALITDDDISDLNALCLVDDEGVDADFDNKAEFRTWLRTRRATNMAYQLSGHLAAMTLNVAVGFVDGGALVYIGDGGDMISINDLMAAAALALCDDGYTPSGDENRDYQEMLKNALDDANNNLNWVNP